MRRDSEDYKQGYKDATISALFDFVGPFLAYPIIAAFIVALIWVADKINSNFVSRSAQGHNDWIPWLFAAVVVFGIYAFRKEKHRGDVAFMNQEREAENSYGFAKSTKNKL